MKQTFSTIALAAALAAGISIQPSAAESVGDFYKGKKIRVLIGYSAGGGYDIYARMITRHMAKHIPGNPTIVPQNKPGAGSLVTAGYMHTAAPKDGTVLGTIDQGIAVARVLDPKRVKFDPSKFIWIGNVNEGNNIIMMWHTANIKTWQDLKKREVIVGGTGVTGGSVQYPRAMNNILGTKFKIIHGFRGGKRVDLAMERGEVEGRGSQAWASVKARSPEYLSKNLVTIPVQMGLTKEKDLDAPLLMDLAPNEAARKVFWLLSTPVRVGRPILTTPGVPADRVKALRAAFDAAVEDKEFRAEAGRANWDINPVSGADVQKIIEETMKTPKQIVDLANAALTEGEVFKCAAIVKDKKLCRSAKKKKKKN